MKEEKTKIQEPPVTPLEVDDSSVEPMLTPTVGESTPKQGSGSWLSIALIIALLLTTAVAGYFAGKKSTDQASGLTPTPTQASATPTVPDTVTPTGTETVTPTATVTPTTTPTVSYVTKTANIKEFGGDFTLKFTLTIPSDVTVTEGKVSSWNGIILKKGAKTFMAFNLPYELYEIQGYSSVTNVASNTISNLKRVRSKKVFANSGTYSFAVAYVTPNMLLSGKDCTEPVISEATSSPCATPALAYSDTVGFSAYCSIDATYQKICDEVMKTIKVVKE